MDTCCTRTVDIFCEITSWLNIFRRLTLRKLDFIDIHSVNMTVFDETSRKHTFLFYSKWKTMRKCLFRTSCDAAFVPCLIFLHKKVNSWIWSQRVETKIRNINFREIERPWNRSVNLYTSGALIFLLISNFI